MGRNLGRGTNLSQNQRYLHHAATSFFTPRIILSIGSAIALIWIAIGFGPELNFISQTTYAHTKDHVYGSSVSAIDVFGGGLVRLLPDGESKPVWEDSKTEPDAAYLLAQGIWLGPSSHHDNDNTNLEEGGLVNSFLNQEEKEFLQWSESMTSNMTVEKASKRVAFKLWDQPFSSLYNTTTTLDSIANSKWYCRLSWGFHWCDPINHGYNYHATHWSTARGVEILESFVRLSDAGRTSPSILYMGDSVMMETWQAGVCSLARANVKFVNPCPVGIIGVTAVCFHHERINGTGILAALSDQAFQKDNWKRAIFGCPAHTETCDLIDNNMTEKKEARVHNSSFFNWDVILPNLGMHYNMAAGGNFTNGGASYHDDVTELVTFLLQHANHQMKTQLPYPTLHMFWGSSPQHFIGTVHGMYMPKPGKGCTSIYPSQKAFRLNRQRTDIVWNVIINELNKGADNDMRCPRNISILDDPSYPETRATLLMPCMSQMMNTCKGGMTHLEVEPFLTHRPEAHPGARCSYIWPMEYQNDPDGENCNPETNTLVDCTHHCWGPLLFQPLWERLEIAVKFHLEHCQSDVQRL